MTPGRLGPMTGARSATSRSCDQENRYKNLSRSRNGQVTLVACQAVPSAAEQEKHFVQRIVLAPSLLTGIEGGGWRILRNCARKYIYTYM